MSLPLLIELDDLELAIGAERFAQLTDRRGAGKAPSKFVQHLIQVATDEGARLLAPGFSTEEIEALVRRDASIRHKMALVAVGVAGIGRPEFTDGQGKFIYESASKDAKKELADIGTKKERSAAEQQNGTINRLIGPRVSRKRYRPRQFVFVDTKDRRGSGGY